MPFSRGEGGTSPSRTFGRRPAVPGRERTGPAPGVAARSDRPHPAMPVTFGHVDIRPSGPSAGPSVCGGSGSGGGVPPQAGHSPR